MPSPVDDQLVQLYLAITAAQSSLATMLSAVTTVAQAIKDTEARAAQVEGDLGAMCINCRDYCVTTLSAAGVVPSTLDRIRNIQPQTDEQGVYKRDEKGNFLIF